MSPAGPPPTTATASGFSGPGVTCGPASRSRSDKYSLQSGNGDGPAQRAAGTGGLAGPGADASENAGKGAALQHHRQGLGRPAFLQEAHLVPHPDIQGTGGLAGRRLLPDALRQDLVAPIHGQIFFLSHLVRFNWSGYLMLTRVAVGNDQGWATPGITQLRRLTASRFIRLAFLAAKFLDDIALFTLNRGAYTQGGKSGVKDIASQACVPHKAVHDEPGRRLHI